MAVDTKDAVRTRGFPMPDSLWNKLRALAAANERSASAEARMAIQEHVERNQDDSEREAA